jgi:hypothetical protein
MKGFDEGLTKKGARLKAVRLNEIQLFNCLKRIVDLEGDRHGLGGLD